MCSVGKFADLVKLPVVVGKAMAMAVSKGMDPVKLPETIARLVDKIVSNEATVEVGLDEPEVVPDVVKKAVVDEDVIFV